MADRPTGDDNGIEILEIVGLDDGDERRSRSGAKEHGSGKDRDSGPVHLSRVREGGRLDGVRQILRELLPALDDLESCVRQETDHDALDQAVRISLRQLWDIFREHELERIEGIGQPFDPAIHDAAIVAPSDLVDPNTVLEVLRVGYKLSGDLVRPALVRVSGAAGAKISENEKSESESETGKSEGNVE